MIYCRLYACDRQQLNRTIVDFFGRALPTLRFGVLRSQSVYFGGNFIAINVAQWRFLLKNSVAVVQAMKRDRTPEQILRNRQQINLTWQDIVDNL